MDNHTTTPEIAASGARLKKVPYIIILALILTAAVGVAVYRWQHTKATTWQKQTEAYQRLTAVPNQACIGVAKAAAHGAILDSGTLKATAHLLTNDPEHKTAVFRCKTGQHSDDLVAGKDVAAVDKQGYEFGAEVTYFNSSEAAKKYAEKDVSPLRYWSLDQEGQKQGIPQTSKFTSLIFGTQLYFDSYTVSGKALLRISLPCSFSNASADTAMTCMGKGVDDGVAYHTIKDFSDSIRQIDL